MANEQVLHRTATETILSVLEGFGESEPKHLVVVWLDDGGDVCMARDDRTSTVKTLGLLEAAKMIAGAYLGTDKNLDEDK